MQIAISGATGLVGTELLDAVERRGDHAIRIVRNEPSGGDILWNVEQRKIEGEKLESVDAVVHLAGESIADGRWDEAKKARILDSRVNGTRLLAQTIAALDNKPDVLVCASAIGYYGDRGDQLCDETTSAGVGYLADVCQQWEAAAEPARAANIRVVHLRIGVVLSPKGGALSKMMLPFKLGVGGKIGDGQQFMSWITLPDLVRAILHCVDGNGLDGPVNGVAPSPARNVEFTKALGRTLGRPTVFPLPAFAARAALGEMADALLLASSRVVPERLIDSGFDFNHSEIETGLRAVIHGVKFVSARPTKPT